MYMKNTVCFFIKYQTLNVAFLARSEYCFHLYSFAYLFDDFSPTKLWGRNNLHRKTMFSSRVSIVVRKLCTLGGFAPPIKERIYAYSALLD